MQTRHVVSRVSIRLPPELTSRAIDEYLETLDDAAFGASTKVVPKYISPVDPGARWTGADGGAAYFAYSTNYLVDLDNAVIVDVEPTVPIRPAETLAARRMIDRVHDRFDLFPKKLVGDTGYGSAEMLGWLVEEREIAGAFLSGTNRNAMMEPSRERTSPTIKPKIVTLVLPERASNDPVATSPNRELQMQARME